MGKLKFLHFQRIAFKFKANGVCSGFQEYHFGDPNDPQMVKNRTLLIRGGPEVPPGVVEDDMGFRYDGV